MNAASMRQSADLSINPNRQEMLNENGQKVGLAYIDYEKTVTITVIPARTGATAILDSASEAAALLPKAGTGVTLTNAGTAHIATTFKDWVLIGSRVRETNNGPLMIEMDLRWLSGISGTNTVWDDIAI